MPAALNEREKAEIVDRLFAVFRDHGFEGSSLTDLSRATGLGRSSLYHHFPRGKEQMAEAVLERGRTFIQTSISDVALLQEPLRVRVLKIASALNAFYAGGENSCVLGRLAAAEIGPAGRRLLGEIFELWTAAITQLAHDSGMPATSARQFAEDWIARLQGALILHTANGDRSPFGRALGALQQLGEKDKRSKMKG